MKAILAFLTTIALTLGQAAQAETSEYEIYFPMGGSSVPYPNLDLNGIEKIKVKTSSSIHQPDQELEEIELVFPNATNLIAKGFVRDENPYSSTSSQTFRTVVNDVWVYSKVLVVVNTPEPISGGSDIHVELQVVEINSSINEPAETHGLPIFNADGRLNNVTPDTIADVKSLNYENDNLTLTLFQKPKFNELTGKGFKIKSNWYGHGERTLNIPTPFPTEEFGFYKAAGIEVQTETFPDGYVDHLFRIKYEDPMGYAQYTQFEPLQHYIDQAYQSNP